MAETGTLNSAQAAHALRITVQDLYRARRALGMCGLVAVPMAVTPQELDRLDAYVYDTLIAHCGVWHPCAALPWSCPVCGAVVGGQRHD